MSARQFFRVLMQRAPRRPRHSGNDVAHEIREAVGPLANGDGTLTGHEVYRYLEREHGADPRE